MVKKLRWGGGGGGGAKVLKQIGGTFKGFIN